MTSATSRPGNVRRVEGAAPCTCQAWTDHRQLPGSQGSTTVCRCGVGAGFHAPCRRRSSRDRPVPRALRPAAAARSYPVTVGEGPRPGSLIVEDVGHHTGRNDPSAVLSMISQRSVWGQCLPSSEATRTRLVPAPCHSQAQQFTDRTPRPGS
jgi:hypothetical protein